MAADENQYVAAPLEGSNSTKSGHRSAVKIYNEKFAPHNGFVQFKDITVDYLCHVDKGNGALRVFELFRKFSGFLSQKVSSHTESGFYSAGSATQIFSNFKMALDDHLKGQCQHLKEPNSVWYDQLYHRLRRICASKASKRGDQISDSADAIWRLILIRICSYLVRSAYRMGYFWRVVFITLYLVIGRAGEAVTAT